ncbi:MAG TPA: glutamate formimidoyltransferase [Gaiellaceae bacterium]|nr:glutamate formimidoyltransferase [Gaiellaceae bacterium]
MLEAVPNVSEGRDRAVVDEIGRAFGKGAAVLDVHVDPDHHRSVFTLVGDGASLVDALLTGISTAIERIDLRAHEGVHPRVGVVDVVPLVPLVPGEIGLAEVAARQVAARVGSELGLPAFLYGTIGHGRRPAYFRRGGLEALQRRVETGELAPAAGPRLIDPGRGAVLVGARQPLVAYNVELATGDLGVVREIAAVTRESGGGMPGVQAIGLYLPGSGRMQVSMNVTDLERAPLHDVVQRVRTEAASRGVAVSGGELVGLVPESVVAAARAAGVRVPGVDESRVLERALGPGGATTTLGP